MTIMHLIKKSALVIATSLLFASCNKDEENNFTPAPVDYAIQYNIDIAKIENYLKTHSVTVTNNPGAANDQNAVFTEVPSLSEESIWGSNPTVPKASLLVKNVTFANVVHKLYYLKFREGVGTSPSSTNQITVAYNGFLTNNSVFDASTGATFTLNQLIGGWQQIFPEFKMGTVIGTNQYEDFGAGAMFLPSAFGYYNFSPAGSIPAYSPLIFSFKLYRVF